MRTDSHPPTNSEKQLFTVAARPGQLKMLCRLQRAIQNEGHKTGRSSLPIAKLFDVALGNHEIFILYSSVLYVRSTG